MLAIHRGMERWAAAGMALAVGWLGGCGYNDKSAAFIKPYEAGQFVQAAAATEEVIGKPGVATKTAERDELVFRLEQGAIYRAAGSYDLSMQAFARAEQLIDQADARAELRLSTETVAALTNQTLREYDGRSYDRQTVSLYQALNAMQLGRVDDARAALNAMYEHQKEAEERFAKEIESLEKKAEEAKKNGEKSTDVSRTQQDPKVAAQLRQAYGEEKMVVPDRKAYQGVTHPFGQFLQGVFLRATATGGSDLENAVFSLKQVKGMFPENAYVAQELEDAEKAANGTATGAVTYVFLENGLAPFRDEIRIDIPIFIVNLAYKDTGVDYVGIALPRIKTRPAGLGGLTVLAEGASYPTTVLSDMDEMVKKDFDNDFPLMLTRTIIATGVKAAAAYGMNKATQGDVYANIATRVLSTAYQAVMNQADLRTWVSLPKQFQVARLATPADRMVTLQAAGQPGMPVKIEDGVVNVIYVKSVAAGQTPVVTQFRLK